MQKTTKDVFIDDDVSHCVDWEFSLCCLLQVN
jgi:hypothetical protein